MAKPMLISPISRQGIKLLRVAAYCRVSSSSADQLNSYATQIDYYTRLAKKKKNEWNMVEIFADEGISGMKAKNRPEFQRMIRMCELHQLDLIITKSVSRFARNVKEALEYVRKLKLLGVGIIFEKARESEKKKVDVCWQIMNNWDVFVDYTWANRKKL